MRRVVIAAGALALLAGASVTSAQSRWSLELTGGAAFATEKVAGEDLNTGFGLGLAARYRFLPHLSVYGGWDWHQFSVDNVAGDLDLVDNGYMFGLRFEHPLLARVSYWARAGGIANHIEVEDDGDLMWDSGHDLGWEVGGGLSVPIGARVKLTPGLRFRSLSRDVEIDGVNTPTDLRYLVIGTGVAWTF